MQPTIRPATPHDLPQVLTMMQALASHHGEQATIALTTLHRQIFELGFGRILVAAEEEGLVGYALTLARPNLVTGSAGHDINHLFVVEWRRRAGIGRALIAAAAAISRAERADYLTISAQSANTAARDAYHAMGLQQVPVAVARFNVDLTEAATPTV